MVIVEPEDVLPQVVSVSEAASQITLDEARSLIKSSLNSNLRALKSLALAHCSDDAYIEPLNTSLLNRTEPMFFFV